MGKPCDVKRSRIELISKPKTFIELGYGLEDRLDQPQINVLKEVKAAKIDLQGVKKISSAAYGLALWLTALVDFSHHSGVMKEPKFIPLAKKR